MSRFSHGERNLTDSAPAIIEPGRCLSEGPCVIVHDAA